MERRQFSAALLAQNDAFSLEQLAEDDLARRREVILKRKAAKKAEDDALIAKAYPVNTTPPKNAEEFAQIIASQGVEMKYEGFNLSMHEQPPKRQPSTTFGAERVYCSEQRISVAGPMMTFVSRLNDFARTDSLDPDQELIDEFSFWQEYRHDGPANSHMFEKAKQESKKPALVALNAAFVELRKTFPNERNLNVLAFGCGNGFADIHRLLLANNSTRTGLNVDLYDPYVEIDPTCRILNGGSMLHGSNLPRKENFKFEPGKYHLVLCMNTIHYNAKPIGGKYHQIDNLLDSIRFGGIITGMFPYLTGITAANKYTPLTYSYPQKSNIELLSIETGEDGVTYMDSRIFGRDYKEPCLEPSVLQNLMMEHGMDARVISGKDVRLLFPDQTEPKLSNPKYYPEMGAFCVFYGSKLHSENLLVPHLTSTDPQELLTVQLVIDTGIEKQSNVSLDRPATFINTGKPLGRDQVWKFAQGGPYLFAEKSDGISASCCVRNNRLTIHAPGMIPIVIPVTEPDDYSFQAELMPDVVVGNGFFLEVNQLTYLNGKYYPFGSGMMMLHTIRKNTILSRCKIKHWTYDCFQAIERAHEGVVVMDFADGPPLPLNDRPVLARVSGTAIYIKKKWTVDVRFEQNLAHIYPDHSGIMFLPASTTFPHVAEFEFSTGKFVRMRPERVDGNSDEVVQGLVYTVSWEKFVDRIAKKYMIKWKPVFKTLAFLTSKEVIDWTVEECLLTALSYPRGFMFISDEEKRSEINRIRKKIYDNNTMNSTLISSTWNISYKRKLFGPALAPDGKLQYELPYSADLIRNPPPKADPPPHNGNGVGKYNRKLHPAKKGDFDEPSTKVYKAKSKTTSK